MLQAPVNLDLGCIVIILKMNLEVKLNLKVHRFIIFFEYHHYASWPPRTLKGKAVVGTTPPGIYLWESNWIREERLTTASHLDVSVWFQPPSSLDKRLSWLLSPLPKRYSGTVGHSVQLSYLTPQIYMGQAQPQLLVMQVYLLHCFGCTDSTVTHLSFNSHNASGQEKWNVCTDEALLLCLWWEVGKQATLHFFSPTFFHLFCKTANFYTLHTLAVKRHAVFYQLYSVTDVFIGCKWLPLTHFGPKTGTHLFFFGLHLLHSINSVDTESRMNKLTKLVAETLFRQPDYVDLRNIAAFPSSNILINASIVWHI